MSATSTHTPSTPSVSAPSVAIVPGMKCLLRGHPVRVTSQPDRDGIVDVALVRDPYITGLAFVSELAPIATPVHVGDTVMIHVGQPIPVIVSVEAVDGDMALFYSASYGESHWMHTSHIVSVRPMFRQLANK